MMPTTWWRSVADRPSIHLNGNDIIAAAEILSWIALPHRPRAGVDLLNQWFWACQKMNGFDVPDLPFVLKKRSLLERQLDQFTRYCLNGFRAGSWYNWKIMTAASKHLPSFNVDVSIRSLAARRGRNRRTEAPNEIRDVWSKRKPIAHMALAAGNAIAMRDKEGGHPRGFNLGRSVFDPSWVPTAIKEAESWARSAEMTRAIDLRTLVEFRRDTF